MQRARAEAWRQLETVFQQLLPSTGGLPSSVHVQASPHLLQKCFLPPSPSSLRESLLHGFGVKTFPEDRRTSTPASTFELGWPLKLGDTGIQLMILVGDRKVQRPKHKQCSCFLNISSQQQETLMISVDFLCYRYCVNGASRWLSGKRICQPVQETQEMWVRSLGQKDPLEKEMATLSSILTWKIPQKVEPGGLLSMGSQRVRHDQHKRSCNKVGTRHLQ